MNEFDRMLSQIADDVKQKNEWAENNLAQTDWQQIAEHTQPLPRNRHTDLSNESKQVNRVFQKLEDRVKLSNLTDSFHPLPLAEIKSKTERSLAKTISNYARFYSSIQTHS